MVRLLVLLSEMVFCALMLVALPPVVAAAVPPALPVDEAPLPERLFSVLPLALTAVPLLAAALPPALPLEVELRLLALLSLLADGLFAPVVVDG